jgi:hypothetical protein
MDDGITYTPPVPTPRRSVDPCPICASDITRLDVSDLGCTTQCGHDVAVTIWPDHVQVQPRCHEMLQVLDPDYDPAVDLLEDHVLRRCLAALDHDGPHRIA